MLRREFRAAALVLAFCGAFQAAAFADQIEGRISRASSQSVDLVVYDAQGRPYPNALNLKVDRYTRFSGVASATGLRPNDAVGADVSREESGLWRADSIRLFQQVNAQPMTKNPSPSLRDVLGNPMVRGALLGAATGAIASSASGGKAGKGALVGAGVGAAAGLLGGLFGNSSGSESE